MSVEPITKSRKPSNDATPRIYTAIASVMAEMGKEGIGKDRRNEQQGYKFRGIDDVYNALAPMLARHDLIVIPKVLSREQVERKNSKGNALFYVTCQVEFTLICSLDGSSVQCVTYGEAMDSADKATNKAMSAAYKYMAMQTFCIPTEGDNDADATTHEVVPAAGGERNPLREPQPRQQRRSNVVVNPKTGKPIDTENARNQRPEWDRFTDKVQGFVEARDADGLKLWFASDEIAEYVAGWVFNEQAHEHFESALDVIAKAERQ